MLAEPSRESAVVQARRTCAAPWSSLSPAADAPLAAREPIATRAATAATLGAWRARTPFAPPSGVHPSSTAPLVDGPSFRLAATGCARTSLARWPRWPRAECCRAPARVGCRQARMVVGLRDVFWGRSIGLGAKAEALTKDRPDTTRHTRTTLTETLVRCGPPASAEWPRRGRSSVGKTALRRSAQRPLQLASSGSSKSRNK